VGELQASYNKIKDEHTALQNTLSTQEELLQTLLTGVTSGSSTNTGGGGYMGQIADAKVRLAQATTEEEQSRRQLTMSEQELKGLEARWKEVEREAGEGKRNLEATRLDVEKFRKKVADSGWSQEKEQQGQAELNAAKNEIRRSTEVRNLSIYLDPFSSYFQIRDNTKQRLSSLDFNFDSPSPNFDRSKVKGLVASLVALKPEDYNKSTALEITAGGKLYNVVVQDERVGKELLERGRLKKRVTLIPLNKVEPRRVPPQVKHPLLSNTSHLIKPHRNSKPHNAWPQAKPTSRYPWSATQMKSPTPWPSSLATRSSATTRIQPRWSRSRGKSGVCGRSRWTVTCMILLGP
jgi:structural maintenance of chromosome 2